MAALSDLLVQQREDKLAAWFTAPAHELSDEMKALLVPYIRWCELNGVRALGARPATIAAYLTWEKDRGVEPFQTLLAIEALHVFAGMANPVATPIVRAVSGGGSVLSPRSWSKVEKEEFQLIPRHMQQVIARREQDRETSLRQGQNKLADERRYLPSVLLKQLIEAAYPSHYPRPSETAPDITKPVTTKERVENHG